MRVGILPIRASTQCHCAVTPWTQLANPKPEASWTLCIGGTETQGHDEVHVVASRQKTGTGLAFLTG